MRTKCVPCVPTGSNRRFNEPLYIGKYFFGKAKSIRITYLRTVGTIATYPEREYLKGVLLLDNGIPYPIRDCYLIRYPPTLAPMPQGDACTTWGACAMCGVRTTDAHVYIGAWAYIILDNIYT